MSTAIKVELDPTTGLPQLPENHYWYVRRDGLYIEKRTTRVYEWTEVTKGDYLWTMKHDAKFYVFKRSGFFRSRYFYKRTDTTTDSLVFKAEYPLDRMAEVSPENVLERATDVYLNWQAKMKRDNFYGMYPPKSLTGQA